MARNEMTEGEGLNRILSNVYGIQGPPAQFMASEVFPMLVMGNERPEWQALEGRRLAHAQFTDGAVVGQYSRGGIWNRPSKNAIVVVEHVNAYRSAASASDYELRIGVSNQEGPSIWDSTLETQFRDTRWMNDVGTKVPTTNAVILTSVNQIGKAIETFYLDQYDNWQLDGPIVLGPGGYLLLQAGNTNQQTLGSMQFIEWAARPGELLGFSV